MKKKIKNIVNRYSYIWPFLIFTIFVLFFTRKFIATPGLILYSEFLDSRNFYKLLQDFLTGWGEYSAFGHSNIGLTTTYGLNPVFWILPPGYFTPILSFLSVLQLFFGNAAGKVYIILGIICPFIGMYVFANYWFTLFIKKKLEIQTYSFISALIYSISSIMSDKIIAAHLKYSFGHSIFPILIASTLLALENSTKRKFYILANGIMVGMLIWLMPQLLTLYILFIGLYYLIVIRDKKLFVPLIAIGFVSFVIGFLLNIHVWLPAFFYSEPLSYIEDPQFVMQFVYYLSRTMPYIDSYFLTSRYDSVLLTGMTLNYVILGKITIILMSIVGIFVKKGKRELFLIFIAIISIIFSIGIKYPFESIFSYLFEHVFLFKPFRDVSKFRILYLFSIALVIPNIFIFIRNRYKKIFWLSIICFSLFIISINPAFYSGNFHNSIIPKNIPDKYYKLNNFLSSQKEHFRVAVYPNKNTIMDYEWYQDVNINSSFNSIFLSVIPLPQDLAVSNRFWSDYQSRYLDVIENNVTDEWAVQRLGDARVKYLIVDLDLPKTEDTVSYLDKNKGVQKIQGIEGFVIYKILNYQNNKVTIHPAVYYFGDVSGIKLIPPEIALINLGIEKTGINLLREKYTDTLVLHNSSSNDLFFTLLSDYNLTFFPEVRFTHDPINEFYIAATHIYEFTQKGIMYYNNEIIQASDKSTISKDFIVNPGKYKLLLSTISFNNQSNSFTLKINDQTFQKHNFRKKKDSQEWIEFGTIDIKDKTATITITNNQTASLFIDQVILVPLPEYVKLKKEFNILLSNYKIVNLHNNSEKIKPTKNIYILSNAYSPYWDICGKQNVRVNFYANGSFCDNKISINPTFIPNTLYQFALYFSWFLFGGSIVGLVIFRKNL